MSLPDSPFPVAPPRLSSDPDRAIRQVVDWAHARIQEISRTLQGPIRVIEEWDELPEPGDQGRVAILPDGKVWRDTGTAWTAEVEAVDLTGKIESHQIGEAAVTTIHLDDRSVVSEKLADMSVTETKLSQGAVTTTKIADQAITKLHMESGITPIEIMDSLPAAGEEGRVVYLRTDGKLYRDTGTAWTSAVPASDLDGQIEGDQIIDFAITARKLMLGTHLLY